MIGAARACVARASQAQWYGLIDLINGNDAAAGRHYTIDDVAVLDLPSAGWAWGIYYKLSSLDTGPSYLLNAGSFGGSPSLSLFITGTGQSTANAVGLNVNGNGIETAADFVTVDQEVLVVAQYDGTTLELYTCLPGQAAVLADSAVVSLGDITLATDWFIGARSDLDDERFFDQELGGPFKASRELTTAEIAQLAAGISPIVLLGADCVGAWAFANGPQAVEPDRAGSTDAARQGTGWPDQAAQGAIIDSGQSHVGDTSGSSLNSPQTIPVTLDGSTGRKIVVVLATDNEDPTSVVFDAGGADEAAFTQRLTIGAYLEVWDVDIPDAVSPGAYNITATASTDPLAWSMVAASEIATGAPHSTDTFGPTGGGPNTDTGVLTTVPDGALIIGAVSHDAYSDTVVYTWTSDGNPTKLMDGRLTGSPFFAAGAAHELVDGGGTSYNFTWNSVGTSSTGYALYVCYGPAS